MNSFNDMPVDLQELMDEYAAGLLDKVGMQELEEQLLASESARSRFVRYLQMHTDLFSIAQARKTTKSVVQMIDPAMCSALDVAELPAEAITFPMDGAANSRTPAFAASGRRRILLAGAFTAALLLTGAVLIGVIWNAGRPSTGEPAVGWLKSAHNCEWGGNGTPDRELSKGRVIHLRRGLAEFRLAGGAGIMLQGPCKVRMEDETRAHLLQGAITVKAAPESEFALSFPHGRAVSAGGQFGMTTTEHGQAAYLLVFDGKVQVIVRQQKETIAKGQIAQLDKNGINRVDADVLLSTGNLAGPIMPPPHELPRFFKLDFEKSVSGTIQDAEGRGIGLTHRLPGTGSKLSTNDVNLRLNVRERRLELTTTNSDINRQYKLDQGEYLGIRLSDLGFSGEEDFEVSMLLTRLPQLERIGQFGLYVGTKSNQVFRGCLISRANSQEYSVLIVNNNGGRDSEAHFVGLVHATEDLRLHLKRMNHRYTFSVENLSKKTFTNLEIPKTEYLNSAKDLYVGLFGANTQSEVRRTLRIHDFRVLVWPRKR